MYPGEGTQGGVPGQGTPYRVPGPRTRPTGLVLGPDLVSALGLDSVSSWTSRDVSRDESKKPAQRPPNTNTYIRRNRRAPAVSTCPYLTSDYVFGTVRYGTGKAEAGGPRPDQDQTEPSRTGEARSGPRLCLWPRLDQTSTRYKVDREHIADRPEWRTSSHHSGPMGQTRGVALG